MRYNTESFNSRTLRWDNGPGLWALLLAVLCWSCSRTGTGPAAPRQDSPERTIRAWMDLGKQRQISGKNDEALGLFQKAGGLALQDGLYALLCEAEIKIGEIIYDHGNYDSAMTYFREADSIAVSRRLDPARAYALYYIGKYNETKAHFAKARKYYDTALAIAREGKDYRQLVLILPSRGKNYISEGKLNLALQCYQEAFQLSEDLRDDLLYAETASHLGTLYLLIGQADKALEYDKKSLVCRGNLHNPEGVAKSTNNLGNVFHALHEPDSAFYYYYRSLALCRATHYKKGLVKALVNIGHLYSDQDQDDKALRLLDSALQIAQGAGYGFGIACSCLNLANIYENRHNLPRALRLYLLSLSELDQTGYDEMLGKIYKGLFDCYYAQGDYRAALRYHLRLLNAEKERLNVENARQVASLNIAFDVERKEKDNQYLRKDNELKESLIKRNTTFIWLVVIALAFTSLFCLYVYNRLYVKKKANDELEALNKKVTDQNTELAVLFSIISHELRNPLYWFQNLSEVLSKKFKEMPQDKVEKSLSALDESAKNAFHLMDNLLQWSRTKLNRIQPKAGVHDLRRLAADATDMFQTILEYKEIEFHNEVPVDVAVYADPDLLGCVVRNLVSNAIKYTPPAGSIRIGCTCTAEEVLVAVEDTGIGLSDAEAGCVFSDSAVSAKGLMQEKGSGIGLKLCEEFVELNGGRIWVNSVPGSYTKFSFTVPAARAVRQLTASGYETNTAR